MESNSDSPSDSWASSQNKSVVGLGIIAVATIIGTVIYFMRKNAKNEVKKDENSSPSNSDSLKKREEGKSPSPLPPLPSPDFDPTDPSSRLDMEQKDVAINHWYAIQGGVAYAHLPDQKDYGWNNTSTMGAYRVINSTNKPIAINVANQNPQGLSPWVWQHVIITNDNMPKGGVFIDTRYGDILIASPTKETSLEDLDLTVKLIMSDPQPVINAVNENYDPVDGNVCESQDKFTNAIKYSMQEINKQSFSTNAIIVGILWVVSLVWSIRLVQQEKGDKSVKMFLAVLCPPVYIISHYLNMYNVNGNENNKIGKLNLRASAPPA